MTDFNKKRIPFKDLYASRWTKLALKIAGGFLFLVIIAWMCVAAYVNSNKKQLLESITAQLNENLNGTLSIESMEPALIRGFPGISISLKNVLLRDSLWNKHHHDVLRAKDVYISVNAFSILSGNPVIKDISLNTGQIYLYTDSTGYRNTDLFKKGRSQDREGERRRKIKRIHLNNVNVILQNEIKHSLFDFSVHNSSGKISYSSKGWSAKISIHTLINTFAFKTQKGSFLKDKELSTSMELEYDERNDVLAVPMQNMQIDGNKLILGGKFSFAEKRSDFNLEVKAPDITFGKVVSLLPQNIALKLRPYNLKNPFSAQASIRGKLKKGGNPSIKIYCQTNNNTLSVKGENIENCAFNSVYNNEIVRGKGFTDQNFAIVFYRMKGSWSGIPFKADSVKVTNLKSPVIGGRFTANFPLTQLNSALGGETFSFTNGSADVNLWYQAPYNNEDQSNRYLYGIIQITDASATYLPRNLPFKNVQARLNFRGRDLFLENIQVQSNSSILKMEGSVKDFSNLYYTDPQKLLLDWHISSPQINLGEFMSFLGKRKNVSGTSKTGLLSQQLNKMLEQGNIHMQLKVDRLLYKKFAAQNVNSDITLRQAGITIKNVSLSHAGGTLHLDGNIDQNNAVNEVKLNTRIVNANVQQLFKAFNNFGQSTITDQNLKGSFSAVSNVSALIKEDGEVVPWSVNGTINFNLRNGALVNFDPMLRLGAFAFPNRNFSNITLKDLKNTLVIRGKTVSIPPMQIESSVLNVFMQGVYGFSTGTDISMQIPLRNPKKDEFIFDKEEKEKRSTRGIVLNMHAIDGNDGKVKFKLGK